MLRWLNRLLGRSDVYFGAALYMRRWRIGPRRWFGLRLHHIVRSDRDSELHDHPFSFVSIILRGGYLEHRADGSATWYGPGSIIYRSAETPHRLELSRPTWTLVIRGPLRRTCGFMTARGWVPWTTFVQESRDGQHLDSRDSNPFASSSSV